MNADEVSLQAFDDERVFYRGEGQRCFVRQSKVEGLFGEIDPKGRAAEFPVIQCVNMSAHREKNEGWAKGGLSLGLFGIERIVALLKGCHAAPHDAGQRNICKGGRREEESQRTVNRGMKGGTNLGVRHGCARWRGAA